MNSKSVTYAILGGIFGAIASSFGKALGNVSSIPISSDFFLPPTMLEWLLKILCIGGILLSNILMINMSALTHDNSTSTTHSLTIITAANFTFSGIFSVVFFGEKVTPLWWIGIILIQFGVLCCSSETFGVKKKKT